MFICFVVFTIELRNNVNKTTKLSIFIFFPLPQVLGPEDMVNPNVDELSMMTYLSQFPDAKLKPGAPIKIKSSPNKVKLTGPGIEGDGLKTGLPAVFHADATAAGSGKLEASVDGPEGMADVRIQDNKDGTCTCSYVPPIDGAYNVNVLWGGLPVTKDPIKVHVSPGTNALACRAYGPGVEGTDLKEGTSTEFFVETAGAGEGELSIDVRGPKGPLDSVTVQQDAEDKDHYCVQYVPPTPSQYIIEVKFAGLHIKDSPFKVRAVPDRPDASKCFAEGPGVTDELQVDEETWFRVYTKGAGRGDLVANARGLHGEVIVLSEEVEPGVTQYTYTPKESGDLVITVKYGGFHIQGSRFRVQVKPPPRPDKCIASGPGLEPKGVRVNQPTNFHVKTKDAGSGNVDVSITGGGDIELPYNQLSSSQGIDYAYTPVDPGQYTVAIKFADRDIPGSPFPVSITDPSKVDITGPGINGEPILVGVPHKYNVVAEGAGPGDIACHVSDSKSVPEVREIDDNNFEILYSPTGTGPKKMNVTFNEAPIPKTPIRLNVYDPSKVLAKGPGLEPGNKTGDTTHFNVDKRKAGEGQLDIQIKGPSESSLVIKDQANDIVRCEYTPQVEGDHAISVLLEDSHIPGSPFNVFIKQKANPSLVIATGDGLNETGLTTDTDAEFFVDYTAAGDGELQVHIEGPAGGVEFNEEEMEPGINKYTYHTDPDENGRYVVQIKFAEEDIPDSPFTVNVKWKSDPSRVIAEGSGLEGGITKELAEFTVDLQKAGDGELEAHIEGPCPVEINAFDSESKPVEKCLNNNGSFYLFQYFPELPGSYTIPIMFNKAHIPGSPFKAVFELGTDPSKCLAHGPGLREHGVRTGDPGNFTIDATMAGPGAVDAIVEIPGNMPVPPIITSNNDGTYGVLYNPHRVGTYEICVTFADGSIPGSPFLVNVTDPSKVLLQGPGCSGEGPAHHSMGSPVLWVADTQKAGPGIFEAFVSLEELIDYDEEREEEKIVITEDGPMYNIEFNPSKPGPYVLIVSYSGNRIDLEPAIEVFDSERVQVYGPAFDGVDLGEDALFYVDCSKAGNAQLGIELYGPADDSLELLEGEGTGFKLSASSPGVYEVDVSYGSNPVPGSPFSIPVRDITKVVIGGSGVTGDGARVGEPAFVSVDTSDSGPAPLEVRVTSPSGDSETLQLEKSSDNQDLYEGSYTPKEPGHYCIEVDYNETPLPESPYQAPIGAPNLVTINWPEHSFVDVDNIAVCQTESAGPGIIEAVIKGPGSSTWSVTPSSNGSGQVLHYSPDAPGVYEAEILYNGFPVQEKPVEFEAVSLSNVSVSGPGIRSGILAKKETYFNVNTEKAGKGNLALSIKSPEGDQLPVEVTDESQSSHKKITYTPMVAGDHIIALSYNKKEIEASPICVSVTDPSQVVCTGDGLNKATVGETALFKADVTRAGKGELGVSVEGPGPVKEVDCHDNHDGTHTVSYVPMKPGVYSVDVKYNDVSVESSPFTVECHRPSPDASKCIVSGIDNPGEFTVDCKDAGGSGLLEVGVSGSYVPVEFVSVRHNGDYTFNVSYDVSIPGETTISVKWHNQHLTGSPFIVFI